MFVFRRAEDRRTAHSASPFGRWWYEGPEYNLSLVCNCPTCGADSAMSIDTHSIGNDGTVSPSYVCRHAPCVFHDAVRLEGWTPPDRRTR